MAQRATTILGLDIRPDAICLAQYIPAEIAVASVAIKPVSSTNDDTQETIGAEFRALVKELKLVRESVAYGLPAYHGVIKNVCIDRDEADPQSAIEWELSQQILGSLDQYSFDFQKKATGINAEENTYLAVAYRHATVDRVRNLIASAKLVPTIADIDLFALINVFEANYPEKLGLPVLLAFCEAGKSTVVLTQNGEFIDADIRSLHAGAEAAEYGNAIRLSRSALESLHSDLGVFSVLETYCAGSLFAIAEMAEVILMSIDQSQILNPFKTIACRAEMSPDDIKRYAPQLAVAIGLAIQGGQEVSV